MLDIQKLSIGYTSAKLRASSTYYLSKETLSYSEAYFVIEFSYNYITLLDVIDFVLATHLTAIRLDQDDEDHYRDYSILILEI